MAAFIAMTSWEGEVTDEHLARPAPDPAAFGMPTEDDGTREDPPLSDRSWAVPHYRPDLEALKAAPTRIVVGWGGVGEGLHRPERDRLGPTARSASDGLPEPPRRLHGLAASDPVGSEAGPPADVRKLVGQRTSPTPGNRCTPINLFRAGSLARRPRRFHSSCRGRRLPIRRVSSASGCGDGAANWREISWTW